MSSERATYLDRAFASWARFLVCVDDGAGIGVDGTGLPRGWAALSERFVALAAEVDAADDQVSRAVARLAAASAYESVGHPDAMAVRRDAEDRLDDLGIDATGWRSLFGDHPRSRPHRRRPPLRRLTAAPNDEISPLRWLRP